jgi:hypothetical protein
MRVFRGAGPKIECPSCGKILKIVEQPLPQVSTRRINQEPPGLDRWYYRVLDLEVGPLSFEALRRHFRARKLAPDSLVRMGTSGRWVLAETVQGLQGR